MKRTQKSQKRTKFLLLLIVLTAILSITATYAWFSTQRDVEIVGMRLNVEVAESMQISLDGKTWTQSITIADMRQFYGTYTGTQDGFTIYQSPKIADGNANYVPTELKPVSSAGQQSSTAGRLAFATGAYTASEGLKNITLCTETDLAGTTDITTRQTANESHPYLAFDIYLRNMSAKTGTDTDTLQLNEGSRVFINTGTADDSQTEGAGKEGVGLENCARVAFLIYGNTLDVNAESTTTTVDPDGEGGDEPQEVTKSVQQQVLELTATGSEVPAIWEPNSKEHIDEVVDYDTRVTAGSEVTTYAIKKEAVGQTLANPKANAVSKVTVPKQGGAEGETEELVITEAVATFKPAYTTSVAGTTAATDITDINGTGLALQPNRFIKMRVYVWLEGQDPDCIDTASLGDKLSIDLKFIKQPTSGGSRPSYAD